MSTIVVESAVATVVEQPAELAGDQSPEWPREAVAEPGPRALLARLPGFLQPLLSWWTGQVLPGQTPLWVMTPTRVLVLGIGQLAAGVGASTLLLHVGPPWYLLLPVTWLITVGAARMVQVTIIHEAVHNSFTGKEPQERVLGEIASAILFVQDFQSYRADHVTVHHSKKLATFDDPDLKFLYILGFRPGLSRRQLWNTLWRTLVSPRFHWLFLKARFTANFVRPRPGRKLLALAIQGAIIGSVAIHGAWIPWLLVWVLPMTILYHISALLQFSSEHAWLRVPTPGEPAKVTLARLTCSRCMGEAPPTADLTVVRRLVAWGGWGCRMVFLHLPLRLGVIVHDLPAHDWHHRHPTSREWPTARFARQRDIEAGCPGWPEGYREIWGLGSAIDSVFTLFSTLPAVEERGMDMTTSAKDEVVMGM